MPEGHTIHRAARLQRTALAGKPVRTDSPQGRFEAGAAALDGCTLLDVEAHGKHLFYRWSSGDTLHVHLGLYGAFRSFAREHPEQQLPPTTPGTRLRMVTDDLVVHLAGPTDCSLMDPVQEEAVKARLGPDPLRRDADPESMWSALRRRTAPIGAALLDQRVVSGIGNVYRCELLYLVGAWPQRPARELERGEFELLWSSAQRFLRAGRGERGRGAAAAGELGHGEADRDQDRDRRDPHHGLLNPAHPAGAPRGRAQALDVERRWRPDEGVQPAGEVVAVRHRRPPRPRRRAAGRRPPSTSTT
jgi:endonuclease-8